jgi:hypothetical protein
MATVPVHERERTGWEDETTGWVGWIIFASVIMGILAVFHVIAGLVALFKDEFFLVRKSGLVVEVDYTAWGWTHVGLGVLLGVAAVSLAAGNMFGRVVGVLLASASAIVNLAFIAAYPVWSVLMIAIDVIVIYAIVVHGRELRV